ncbi:Protein yellow [Pseudolycoriella hygida]|uniref:Protein yellow n=1 Tax=Pseudolycoriella hygida TaxID=35572 RepID=A0A9Q0MKX6_9DIPT|nr:Protein yellow [Pseudolycoriella hygida]
MFALCVLILVTSSDLHAVKVQITKQWTLLTYNLPAEFPADNLEFNNPQNVVATGFAISGDRLFLATPRLFSGVPATLSSVHLKTAYPNWDYHRAGRKSFNCSEIGLVSVYRIRIDSCKRLWVLDAGVSRSFEDAEVTCQPKILVFDLKTNQVVRRIDFPGEVVKGDTLFTNMIIDETTSRPENNCDDVFVYITDTIKPAIVVYDSSHDLTWRSTHPSMYPDPNFSKPNILGHRFTLMDGIVGLAFDARTKVVYFQPLATDRLFSIETSALRAGPSPFGSDLPVKLVGKKSSQGIGLAVSPIDGSIFFSPMSETAVAKWNPTTNNQSVLAYDTELFQFVADIRISSDPSSIYVLSSKFHRFFLRNLKPTEINTRIVRIEDNVMLATSKIESTVKPRHSTVSVNVIKKRVQNPFPSFINANKGPIAMAYQQKKAPMYKFASNEDYLNVRLGDLNGLRITNMVSYNITTFH